MGYQILSCEKDDIKFLVKEVDPDFLDTEKVEGSYWESFLSAYKYSKTWSIGDKSFKNELVLLNLFKQESLFWKDGALHKKLQNETIRIRP